jgi:hypothetical protein
MERCGDVDGGYDSDGRKWGGDVWCVGRSVCVDEGRGRRVDVGRGEYVHGEYEGERRDVDGEWGIGDWGWDDGDIGDEREFEVGVE